MNFLSLNIKTHNTKKMIFSDEHEICEDEISKTLNKNAPNDFGGFSVITGGGK